MGLGQTGAVIVEILIAHLPEFKYIYPLESYRDDIIYLEIKTKLMTADCY